MKAAACSVEGLLFDNWFDPIETAQRKRARSFIEELIHGELTAALYRPRYGRRGRKQSPSALVGHRHECCGPSRRTSDRLKALEPVNRRPIGPFRRSKGCPSGQNCSDYLLRLRQPHTTRRLTNGRSAGSSPLRKARETDVRFRKRLICIKGVLQSRFSNSVLDWVCLQAMKLGHGKGG